MDICKYCHQEIKSGEDCIVILDGKYGMLSEATKEYFHNYAKKGRKYAYFSCYESYRIDHS